MVGGLLVFVDSIMEGQILGALLGVPSSQQAMIMMLQLMNMVSLLGEIRFFFVTMTYMCQCFFYQLKCTVYHFFNIAATYSKHVGAYPGLPVTAFCRINFFYKFN